MFTPAVSAPGLPLLMRSGVSSPDLVLVAANLAVAADCACSNLLMVGCRSMLYLTFGFDGSLALLPMQPMMVSLPMNEVCTVVLHLRDAPWGLAAAPGATRSPHVEERRKAPERGRPAIWSRDSTCVWLCWLANIWRSSS